jgi:hypothetical protein
LFHKNVSLFCYKIFSFTDGTLTLDFLVTSVPNDSINNNFFFQLFQGNVK